MIKVLSSITRVIDVEVVLFFPPVGHAISISVFSFVYGAEAILTVFGFTIAIAEAFLVFFAAGAVSATVRVGFQSISRVIGAARLVAYSIITVVACTIAARLTFLAMEAFSAVSCAIHINFISIFAVIITGGGFADAVVTVFTRAIAANFTRSPLGAALRAYTAAVNASLTRVEEFVVTTWGDGYIDGSCFAVRVVVLVKDPIA